MADPNGCPAWQSSHEDQCGAFKGHVDVSDVTACKALCTPDALGRGKPCMAVMYNAQLKICNIYEEQDGCPTGQEHPPAGYQQLLKMCPADACQLTKGGECELTTTGWVIACVLLLSMLGYVAVGTIYNMKTKGLALSADALPHRSFWAEIQGLCGDGIALVVATATGDRHRAGHANGAHAGYCVVSDVSTCDKTASTTEADVDALLVLSRQETGHLETSVEPTSGNSSSSSNSSSDGHDDDAGSSDDEIIE